MLDYVLVEFELELAALLGFAGEIDALDGALDFVLVEFEFVSAAAAVEVLPMDPTRLVELDVG